MILTDNFLMKTFIMLLSCMDRPGIVHDITASLLMLNANIIAADQHSTEDSQGVFFIRIQFVIDSDIDTIKMNQVMDDLKKQLSASIQWYDCSERLTCSILVSKEDHCLQELLYHWKSGFLNIDIQSIISNHDQYESLANWYSLPFHYVSSESKHLSETEIIGHTESTDILIMARYMQILSSEFLINYRRPVVNIHHSFLPSFAGAKPYHQAFIRGVKLIGATAHYATQDLDEGPIIVQKVVPVSHRDSIEDLKVKGRQLEKQCLVEAIQAISEHRVIIHENKTIVF